MLFPEIAKRLTADEYLAHKYEPPALPLPLQDEDFIKSWDTWLDQPETAPETVRAILSDGFANTRLTGTLAGRIPVVCARSRECFERTARSLNPGAFKHAVPRSVNAFMIDSRASDLSGHRIALLNEAGYSGISGGVLGLTEEEWLEKSKVIRITHECCHYFTLRALGGMKNHALDEIAADCAGQLAAFGSFSARAQKIFFGIENGEILPNGRFHYYVKNLSREAVDRVCAEVSSALSRLERCLDRNAGMSLAENRARLIVSLLTSGVRGIGGVDEKDDLPSR
jgi:hypothetical protein